MSTDSARDDEPATADDEILSEFNPQPNTLNSSLNTDESAGPSDEESLRLSNGLDLVNIHKGHFANFLHKLAFENPEVQKELKSRVRTKKEYKKSGIGKLRYVAKTLKGEHEKYSEEQKACREKRKAEKLAAGETPSSSDDDQVPVKPVKKGKGKAKAKAKAKPAGSDTDSENEDDPDAEANSALKKREAAIRKAAKKLNQPLNLPAPSRSPSPNSDQNIEFESASDAWEGEDEVDSNFLEAQTLPLGVYALQNSMPTSKKPAPASSVLDFEGKPMDWELYAMTRDQDDAETST